MRIYGKPFEARKAEYQAKKITQKIRNANMINDNYLLEKKKC